MTYGQKKATLPTPHVEIPGSHWNKPSPTHRPSMYLTPTSILLTLQIKLPAIGGPAVTASQASAKDRAPAKAAGNPIISQVRLAFQLGAGHQGPGRSDRLPGSAGDGGSSPVGAHASDWFRLGLRLGTRGLGLGVSVNPILSQVQLASQSGAACLFVSRAGVGIAVESTVASERNRLTPTPISPICVMVNSRIRGYSV